MASTTNNNRNSASLLSSLGEASGIAFLLSNHAIFGMAERCCYHFDLIETLTSLPLGRLQQQQQQQQQSLRSSQRRERGLSISSQEGGAAVATTAASHGGNDNATQIKEDVKLTTIMNDGPKKQSNKTSCISGVVSLLECVPSIGGGGGGTSSSAASKAATELRAARRALRSKHREFNTRAQAAWGTRGGGGSGSGGNSSKNSSSSGGGGGGSSVSKAKQKQKSGTTTIINTTTSNSIRRRCHQPRHLPLPLNPNTRVTFAYELTSIAIVVDASPSLTVTMPRKSSFDWFSGGEEEKKSGNNSSTTAMDDDDDDVVVPLDRLGKTLQTYLLGLVQPIDIPPVAVSGKGVGFGRWTPNLAVTVVAAYPPTSNGDEACAGLLVRDYRVTDEASVLELVRQVERWALREVEGTIAKRLSGQRDFVGDGVGGRNLGSHNNSNGLLRLDSFALPYTDQEVPPPPTSRNCVRSSVKELLAVGDAALATLPPEGRPIILVASDCQNLECTTTFEFLTATDRSDVPLSVIDLSLSGNGGHEGHHHSFDFSSSLAGACQMSGGVFLHRELLESCVKAKAGSTARQKPTSELQLSQTFSLDDHQSRFQGDIHFCSKKRSIRPNALQWYTLFILSPFTPGGYLLSSVPRPMYSVSSSAGSSLSLKSLGHASKLPPDRRFSVDDSKTKDVSVLSPPTATSQERIMFSKYCIQPVRIKSLLMSRVLEGYRARRYGHTSQDSDKVSIHFTLRLAECDVVLHYEVSFVSSPWHIPTVGNAHIKLELSGENTDFIQIVKKMFMSNRVAEMVQQGKRIPAASMAAAEQICKLLRWTRKEDYLDSYLCLPGWGDVDHMSPGSSFLRRLETLSSLQRHRHFRSETLEVVTTGGGNPYERAESIFGDMEQNSGEKELLETLGSWSTEVISDAKIYLKEITRAKEDDLAYYCILRVSQCPELSRLFTITVDFHGELDTEQRLAVLFTLKESLRSCAEVLLLDRRVSNYITLRPLLPSSVWKPSWGEYFLQHKSWELLKDPEVLPLLFKRRHIIGGFFILHADENRAVFCKFVDDDHAQTSDMVLYQVLQRQDGIYVDIHLESCRAVFHPSRSKSFPLYALYERVRRRDKDCAKNLRSRTNLLAELDSRDDIHNASGSKQQEEDVARIMKVSTPTIAKMPFFSEGSGSANNTLCSLLARHMTSDLFHTQTAQLSVEQVDRHEGVFFIMRLDWYVLSVACLESRDQIETEDEMQKTYRNLTFFTAGIIDLYQSDDETNVAKYVTASDEQFSEALPIDEIMTVHPKLYAIALYEALRNEDYPVTSFRSNEVSYAMSLFSFKEVLHASIELDDLTEQLPVESETSTGQRLAELITSILSPIPGSNDTLFYYHGKAGCDAERSGKAQVHEATTRSNDLEQTFEDNSSFCDDFAQPDDQSIGMEEEKAVAQSDSDCTPLYFQFTITDVGDVCENGETPVSLKRIRALKRSAILTAQVSVFESLEENTLPFTHAHVIRKLQHALNEFASEQTLDKYRYIGSESLTTEAFKIVMRNLSQSKHHVLTIPITFYVTRVSSMIKASDPTGVNESDLDHGYHILLSELESCEFTTKSSVDSFLIVDGDTSSTILLYWCFVQVNKSSGNVTVRVHHPHGRQAAQQRAETAASLVEKILDRTNQKLLLESMYKTRKAPAELIVDIEVDESRAATIAPEEVSPPRVYACPVQYQHEFPLHRRVSPSQAVRTLHSSILQNFMLSNRNGISVYRDESNNIYYMNLIYRKSIGQGDEENSHVIVLLVYGIAKPGPVITEELVRLLQRKLLMLPLDALSSVLNKNPQYNLLSTDMSFINNFSRRLKEIEPEIESVDSNCVKTYELPSHVEDPLTLLLMFRQNICGSTFIQLLHYESDEVDVQSSDMIEVNTEDGDIVLNGLPGNEFCFFFNSLGLGLDPAAQHVTTLTNQGRIYSRQAGSGIAVIQVSLLHGSNLASRICVGKGDKMLDTNLRVSKEYISLNPNVDESKEAYKLLIKVTNTTVDIEAIQKWVYLSLCQVLAAYTIEHHRESCLHATSTVPVLSSLAKGDRNALNQLMPGLPPLEDMMTITIDLPHPAMMKVQSKTRLQATSLATLTLDLTEKAILSAIFNKSMRLPHDGIEIFRMANAASRVSVTRDRILKAKVVSFENGRVIRDNHVDSPEYVCVFGLRQSDGNAINSPQHLFFKEIHVARPETSVFTEVLHRIKSLKPALFERHMVFILRVSRQSRSLMTYNVSPQIWAAMKTNFNDIEGELSKAEEARREHYVGRCIDQFPFIRKKQQVGTPSVSAAEPPPQNEQLPKEEPPPVTKGPVRRIKRPTSMLRPKLIGKSVDGAAAQAVQASRLRAKTRPSVPHRTSISIPTSAAAAPSSQKKQPKDKQSQQKQRRESGQREIVTRSIVQSVPAANLLKFYRDLTAILKEASESHLSEPVLSQSILQYVTHAYFASIKERQSPLMLTRLISTCCGSPICSRSISHLQCDNEPSSMKSFLHFLTARWKASAIQSPYPQFVYLQKDLLVSQRRRVSIMIEVLMTWNRFAKCYIFHCRAWLINSSDNSKNPMQLSRVHAEQEAAAIDAIASNFMSQLTLNSQVLNFAGSRLESAATKQDKTLNTLALLRCTFQRFSEEVQLDYCIEGSADYMLQRRFVAPSSILSEELIENYDRTKLFEHFSSSGESYKIHDCSGDGEKVFVCRMLKIAGLSCYVFFAAHETVESALEVFTLCLTKGKRADTFVAVEGSLFAERICDVVLEYSMTAVERLFTAAASKMRNDHLWKRLGSEFSSTFAVSELLLDELRQCCHHIDLMDIEPRLRALLIEEENELQLPWDEIFKSFDRSPLFHCIRIARGEEINWVVYSREYDIFIDIVSESVHSSSITQKHFRRVRLLLKDNFGEQITAKKASDQLLSFILNWVWEDCWLDVK